jgi:hypothetical protein
MDNVMRNLISKCESLLTLFNPFNIDILKKNTTEELSSIAATPVYLGSLSQNDARFLVAFSASQESYLIDLKRDFEKWDHGDIKLVDLLKTLLKDGTLLLTERDGEGFKNFSMEKSLKLLNIWEHFGSWNTIVYLTEQGDELWETDDWGISIERANELMDLSKSSMLPE